MGHSSWVFNKRFNTTKRYCKDNNPQALNKGTTCIEFKSISIRVLSQKWNYFKFYFIFFFCIGNYT